MDQFAEFCVRASRPSWEILARCHSMKKAWRSDGKPRHAEAHRDFD
jgi:hypothetical protein